MKVASQRQRQSANFASIVKKVANYYSGKLLEHGPTPRGVDWNSAESQRLRFAELLRIIAAGERFSINDYGCGYGGLLDFLEERGDLYDYTGFEISEAMLREAKRLHPAARFVDDDGDLPVSDYTVASGIFNVRLDTPDSTWRDYICEVLASMRRCSSRGFAFNVLTSYSDVEKQRKDLYYADPLFFFDYCQRNFSRHVALFHDYPLYEFTMAVML